MTEASEPDFWAVCYPRPLYPRASNHERHPQKSGSDNDGAPGLGYSAGIHVCLPQRVCKRRDQVQLEETWEIEHRGQSKRRSRIHHWVRRRASRDLCDDAVLHASIYLRTSVKRTPECPADRHCSGQYAVSVGRALGYSMGAPPPFGRGDGLTWSVDLCSISQDPRRVL